MEGIPADLCPAFEAVQPHEQLRSLVAVVATRWSLTAEPDTPQYVGVRPASHGVIAGYVNRAFVDLRLTPERAKRVAVETGWRLLKTNGVTGTLRVPAGVLADAATREKVADLFIEALGKSESGPGFEGGAEAAKQYAAQQPVCSIHLTEMLGGSCDRCE